MAIGFGAGSEMQKNMHANRSKTRSGKGTNKTLQNVSEKYNRYSGKIDDTSKLSEDEMNDFRKKLEYEKKKNDTIILLTAVGIILTAAIVAYVVYY